MKSKTCIKLIFIKRALSKPLGSTFSHNGVSVSRLQFIKLGLKQIDNMFNDSS